MSTGKKRPRTRVPITGRVWITQWNNGLMVWPAKPVMCALAPYFTSEFAAVGTEVCTAWAAKLFPRLPEPGECIEYQLGLQEIVSAAKVSATT